MTNDVTVEFSVERAKDVPRIGQRKTLRVNGRREVLFCRKLDVDMVRDWDDTGTHPQVTFEGNATYGPTVRTWRGESGH